MDEKSVKLAKEWFESAASDFEYAKIGLKQEIVYPQIAFLCQQSAEKYLKGFLVLHKVEPPRIHDLPKLLDTCKKIDSELEDLREACELLTGFYIEARYPPDIPDYSKKDIEVAFDNAEIVKDGIEKRLA